MGVPFCFSGAFTAVSLGNSAVILLEHSFPQVPVDAWLGVVIGFYVSAYSLLRLACVLTPRVRARVLGWQSAADFLDEYGPGTPLAKRYVWFGAVGTIMGFLCGIALVFSPVAVMISSYFILSTSDPDPCPGLLRDFRGAAEAICPDEQTCNVTLLIVEQMMSLFRKCIAT
ncbi:hypothetical protein EDB86DRAFT_1015874 [Lactarius hatsudake]|nr:hypothetical protein EDB86DRAFT_1015874 [Lactarius hatsudake]